jgi:methyl coenzyme M reductase subunit C-like uncharacterized protein (methanogenesis marker protein 7)
MADLFDNRKVSLVVQLEAAKREAGYRRYVYPGRIEAGKMTRQKAAAEIEAMDAIVETIAGLIESERKMGRL